MSGHDRLRLRHDDDSRRSRGADRAVPAKYRIGSGLGRRQPARCRQGDLHAAGRQRVSSVLANPAPVFRRGASGRDDDFGRSCGSADAHRDRGHGALPARRLRTPP